MDEDIFKEERSYEFDRLKRTVRYKRISAYDWLENPSIAPAVQAIVGLTDDEKVALLKSLIPKEYMEFSAEVNKFIGNINKEDMAKK